MFEIPVIKTIALGPLTLQIWGAFVGLGMLLAYFLAIKTFRKRGIDSKHLDRMFPLLVISALVGARLLWAIIEYETTLENPLQILKIWDGGMAFTGGFLAALAALAIYVKKHRLSFWNVADALAIPLAGGLLVGRWGCLFTGLHPGIITTIGPVTLINGEAHLSWPAFAILNWLIAFIVLSKIAQRNLPVGRLSHLTLLWWGAWRFGGDFIRSSEVALGGDPRYLGLTPTQYLALVIIIGTLLTSLSWKTASQRI